MLLRNDSKAGAALVWACLVVFNATLAGDAASPVLKTPLLEEPPVIDGQIRPEEWRVAHGFGGFVTRKHLQQRRVRGWVGASADTLYVAIASQMPNEGELKTDATRDSLVQAVRDDSVEVYVNPTPDATDNVDYQFLVNSKGRGGYKIHKLGNPDEPESWRGQWRQAHGLREGWWHFECAIPIASMNLVVDGRKTTEGTWRINLTRNWKSPWKWSSLTGGYAHSGLRFDFTTKPAPAVQFRYEGHPAWTPHEQRLRVYNPNAASLKLRADLKLSRDVMPELRKGGTLVLEPGESREFVIPIRQNDPTTIFQLDAAVAGADGETVYYQRRTTWKKADDVPRWSVAKAADVPPLDISFGYYPYRNRMRLVLDINGLRREAEPTGFTVVVREHWSGKEVKAVDFPLADFDKGRQEKHFSLPKLDGDYEIVATVEGEGTPDDPVVKRFERRRFPWERLPGGRSTTVYPPFEPITLDGRTLRTVLREHLLNDAGLLDQVQAESHNTGIRKPILAAPMRYTAVIDGSEVPVEAEELTITRAEPHEVVTDAVFRAGALQATSRQIWDYDGTAKVELTLHASGDSSVDRLILEIPFRDDAAPLMHANGDRIRASVTQAVPGGEGVVWDASSVVCDDLPRNFCPYIYLGSAVRGLCWFAENDLGWSWDSSKPNLDVVRRDGQVVLRVHLVNERMRIREPRRITFGLLAAPVKPPLNLDADDPHWWRHRYYRGNYTLLGTDINWLSIGSCGSVYPAGKNLYLWEMLARANQTKLDPGTRKAVVKYGRQYFEPYGADAVKKWNRHARYNLIGRFAKKMIFYYNRASCQRMPEFQTFKDEWVLTDLRSVGRGNSTREIKVVPTPSFIDYNLYWYARSFEVGNNQGVYWDNFFFRPSFNTEMTAAYRREDGSIRAATGIWGLRELARRTFIMLNERNMPPVTMVHMTSFSPLPLLSFATLQYDWEWKYSQGDVQDRFSREYTRLVSSGELAGTWPVLLHDHGKLSHDHWTQRTYTAVRLLHELDGRGGFGMGRGAHQSNRAALAEPILAMLEKPGLEVYKYWEDRAQPVTADHPDAPVIVYAVPGKEALVGVVSYARNRLTVNIEADLKTLALPEDVVVTDVETGTRLPCRDGASPIVLKSHEMRLLRFAAVEKGEGGE